MLLNYVALAIGLIGLLLVFYTFIYIHDIPYQVAKRKNHPQTEAIHLACWLSLFTLHALWPLIFIWAVMKPQPLSVRLADPVAQDNVASRIDLLEAEVTRLRNTLTPREVGTQS